MSLRTQFAPCAQRARLQSVLRPYCPCPDGTPENQDEAEECLGCGQDHTGDLLMCDVCPNVFCTYCVGKAHGGGTPGLDKANRLMADPSCSWACLVCHVPDPLEGIQESCKPVANGDQHVLSTEAKDKLTLELFEQLMRVGKRISRMRETGDSGLVAERES